MSNKTFIFLFFSLFLAFSSFAQTNYHLDGKIEGLGNQKVYLSAEYNGKKYGDSTTAKDGVFSFKGKTPGALFYGLRFEKNKFLGVFIDVNDKIKIEGKLNQLNDASITGSKSQVIWKEWQRAWMTITARAGVLYKQLDSIGKGDRTLVNKEFDKLNLRLIDSVEIFVKKYPSSPVTAFVITDRFVNYPNPEKAKSTYAALSQTGKNTLYGLELGQSIRIAEKTGIGVSPDFTLPNQQGKLVKLSDFKGKVVLVDFWASWCVPCRNENPNLTKAYAKYHDKGFEIISISLDNNRESWLKAIADDKLVWLHLSDLKAWKSDLVVDYGIKSIPMSFLVDRSGKIIAKDLRGDSLEKKLETLYK